MELRKLEKSARLQLQDLLDEQNTPEPQNIPNPQGRPPKPVGLSQLSHRQLGLRLLTEPDEGNPERKSLSTKLVRTSQFTLCSSRTDLSGVSW